MMYGNDVEWICQNISINWDPFWKEVDIKIPKHSLSLKVHTFYVSESVFDMSR